MKTVFSMKQAAIQKTSLKNQCADSNLFMRTLHAICLLGVAANCLASDLSIEVSHLERTASEHKWGFSPFAVPGECPDHNYYETCIGTLDINNVRNATYQGFSSQITFDLSTSYSFTATNKNCTSGPQYTWDNQSFDSSCYAFEYSGTASYSDSVNSSFATLGKYCTDGSGANFSDNIWDHYYQSPDDGTWIHYDYTGGYYVSWDGYANWLVGGYLETFAPTQTVLSSTHATWDRTDSYTFDDEMEGTGSSTATTAGDAQLSGPVTTDTLIGMTKNATPATAGFVSGNAGAACGFGNNEFSVWAQSQLLKFTIRVRPGRYILPLKHVVHFNNIPDPNGSGVYGSWDYESVTAIKFQSLDGSQAADYPSGDPFPVMAPYAKLVDENGCTNYYGGTASYEPADFLLIDDGKDHGCPTDCNGKGTFTPNVGMPSYWVTEPYINLWIGDTPAKYTTSLGETMAFTMTYCQRDSRPMATDTNDQEHAIYGHLPHVPVTGWNHNWFSYLHVDSVTTLLYLPGGGVEDFAENNGDTLLPTSNGYRVVHVDGSLDAYELATPKYVADGRYVDVLFSISGLDASVSIQNNRIISFTSAGTDTLAPMGSSMEQVAVGSLQNTNMVGLSWNGWQYATNNHIRSSLPSTGYVQKRVFVPGPVGTGSYDLLWTEHIDPYGNITRLSYVTNSNNQEGAVQYFLSEVTDYDGKTIGFSYDTNNYLRQVSLPYDKTVLLTHDNKGCLSSVTDALGMTTWFTSQNMNPGGGNGATNTYWINSMSTPYGQTHFDHEDDKFDQRDPQSIVAPLQNRSLVVTTPDGKSEKYEFRYRGKTLSDAELGIGIADLAAQPFYINGYLLPTPQFGPLDNTGIGGYTPEIAGLHMRNSYHWKAGVNQTNLSAATITHWLMNPDGFSVSGYPSVKQEPGFADGRPGPQTWYDYPGKPNAWQLGDFNVPESAVLQLMPNGHTTKTHALQDDHGNVVQTDSTFEDDSGNVQTRTKSYSYTAVTNTMDGVAYPAIRLSQVQSPNGTQTVTFSYVSKTVTDGDHTLVIQRPQTVVTTDGLVSKTNTYNDRQQISTSTTPSGAVVAYSYGMNGFIGQISVPGINPLQIAWNQGRIASTIDRRGLNVSYAYDFLDRLTNVVYPDGTSVARIYDRLDLVGVKDRLDKWAYATYDDMRRRLTFQDRNGNTTSYGYCPCGALTSITDPLGNTTVRSLDAGSRITAVTSSGANGNPVSTSYLLDNIGRMVGAVLPTGQTVSNYVNMQGLSRQWFVNDQLFGQRYYDAKDRLTAMTDVLGRTVTLGYDAFNRVTNAAINGQLIGSKIYNGIYLASRLDASNNPTSYRYDALGRIMAVTNANQGVVCYGYDSAGDLTGRTNELGAGRQNSYDVYGRVFAAVDEAGNSATFGYDANNRLRTMTSSSAMAGVVTFDYDNNGNLTNRIYNDNGLNWEVSTVLGTITESFGYDALNRLTSMMDQFGHTTFAYTNVGAFKGVLASESGPAGVVNYGYDAVGFLRNVAVGNYATSYDYDSLNRLQTVTTPGGAVTYDYNGISSQIHSTSFPGGVSRTYGYTTLGQVESINLTSGSGTLDSYSYVYDGNNRRSSMSRTQNAGNYSNHTINYGYDAIGQLISAQGFEASNEPRLNETYGYLYDAAGNLTNEVSGIGAAASRLTLDYTAGNELLTIPKMNGRLMHGVVESSVASLTGEYASAGLVASNAIAVNADHTFGAFVPMAAAGQQNPNNNAVATFKAYDVNGTALSTNRITVLNSNPKGTAITFDAGNLTRDPQHTYVYNGLDELCSVDGARLVYDGLGRLRAVNATKVLYDGSTAWGVGQYDYVSATTTYVYSGFRVLQEQHTNYAGPSGPATAAAPINYSYGHELLARADTDGTAFYHQDANGNVIDMTDTQGNLVAQYLYSPYGELINKSGELADLNPYRFSSERYIPELNLYYYGYRFYSPELHRWINQDPIGFAGGKNLYGFVGNDPINQIDLLGLYNPITGPNGPVGSGSGLPDPLIYFPQLPQAPDFPSQNRDSSIYIPTSQALAVFGLGQIVGEYGSAGATIGNNGKIYLSGWGGGSRGNICTVKISKCAHAGGYMLFGAVALTDGIGVWNGDITWGKYGINTGFGMAGLFGGPPGAAVAGTYSAIDNLYPGGWEGYGNDTGNVLKTNIESVPYGLWTLGYPIIGP